MAVRLMSDVELARVDTLVRVERGELAVADAEVLLGLSERHVFRLLDRLHADGAAGLVSSKRGKPSNRRYSDAFRERVIAVVCEGRTWLASILPSATTSTWRARRSAS